MFIVFKMLNNKRKRLQSTFKNSTKNKEIEETIVTNKEKSSKKDNGMKKIKQDKNEENNNHTNFRKMIEIDSSDSDIEENCNFTEKHKNTQRNLSPFIENKRKLYSLSVVIPSSVIDNAQVIKIFDSSQRKSRLI